MKLRRSVSAFKFRASDGAKLTPDTRYLKPDTHSAFAFTMIEIALCLAIIGFALVAIIGVLPIGMDVQKQNREETIINQEATVWMDAIRNGARGYDDLTNYIIGITNFYRDYTINNGTTNAGALNSVIYTRAGALNTGSSIVGILSTPKFWWTSPNTFRSNFVVAGVYAISGSAVEKPPQKNQDVLDLAFKYRLIPEIAPYVPLDPASTNFSVLTNPPAQLSATNSTEFIARMNRWREVQTLQANSYDIRLSFAWPLQPSGLGNGRQTFRLFTTGCVTNVPNSPLYFIQPSIYMQVNSK